jgi:hypothetical protein
MAVGSAGFCLFSIQLEHRMAEITPHHVGNTEPAHLQTQITGSAAKIQAKGMIRVQLFLQSAHSLFPPVFINMERKEVIQEIIARSYGRKHILDLSSFGT